MVSVVVFEFSGLRCQPLRRALVVAMRYTSPKEIENEFRGVKRNL
ncbi:iron transporter [Vibrio cholerae]|nr:iron transporter [Vibrio cholerae]